MVTAEIITIGDEILIGQIVDTNSAWMGVELNKAGINIKQITSIGDEESAILKALSEAERRADIILITGGLGPTKDDITKYTIAKYFNSKLTFSDDAFKDVEAFFKARNREISDVNKKQAELPECCIPLQNTRGTAPGMWFEQHGKIFVSMPGVPYEMKALMELSVIPKLKEKFTLPAIKHKTILTQGIGESILAEMIGTWEDELSQIGMKLAYLPAPGAVRLRLSIYGNDEKMISGLLNKKTEELLSLVGKYVYGFDEETLAGNLGALLKEKKLTLSVAESCSGGYIAHQVTSVAGSSEYYKGGINPYDNAIKIGVLKVKSETIAAHGAVSEETALEMAKNCLTLFDTDVSISTTGIAGPSGGSPEKPVGTVFIAVARKNGETYCKKFQFGFNRELNIQVTATYALNMALKFLKGELN